MEGKLYKAAIEGSTASLQDLLIQDELALERVTLRCLETTPLHVAAWHNQLGFVTELLRLNPELAESMDSRGRSALHVASAKGHVEIVRALVNASPRMCTACDVDGRNAVHIAAIKGKVEVLEELVRASSHAARAKVDREDTILHLCVKYDQERALKWLLENFECQEYVNAKDSSGNTILHLAVMGKKHQILEYTLDAHKLDVNATNAYGYTAMDILVQNQTKEAKDMDFRVMKDFLQANGAKKAKALVQDDWLTEKREALMFVASVLATMAFQAGVCPPSGVWESDSKEHRAGETVMAYNYPHTFPYFLRANTIGFVASLSIILLLMSGLPFKKRGFMWLLVVIMWLTITSMAFTYAFSITAITPKKDREPLTSTIVVGVIVWCSVMTTLLVFHTVCLIRNIVEERRIKKLASLRILKYVKCRECRRQPRTLSMSAN